MQPDAGHRAWGSLAAQEQRVEVAIQDDERGERRCGRTTLTAREGKRAEADGGRARPMSPAEVEGGTARLRSEHERHPGCAAPGEVGLHHGAQRPRLQVLAEQLRVELDAN